jgi:gluconate 2-dehydrogenase alpha chain
MKTLPAVDVVIAGGGWAGLLMAKELAARTALSILVLERGGPRKANQYAEGMDEVDYALRLRLMQDPSRDTVTFRPNSAERALPIRQFASFLPGDGIGGAGEHWNGMTPRFQPDVFEVLTRTIERYGRQRLPENHAIQDWGITHAQIEPYYGRVEQLLGVSGDTGRNPFEGPRSSPYPTPPMKQTQFALMLRDAAKSLGYHPYPGPSANLSQAYKNPDGVFRPACEYCGFCDRFGCMVGAKAQPTNVLLPVIQRHKNVEIRTGATVRRIVHKDGNATGVNYIDSKGEETFQPARLTFLSSWTLNNTRLLLLSGLGRPYDPGTGQGVVGRNLTHQANTGATLFFDKPLNAFMAAGAAIFCLADLDADNFDHGPLDFLRGAHVFANTSGHRPIQSFGLLPEDTRRNWGSEWKKAAVAAYDHDGRIAASGEHLAYRVNYMDLDPTYRDAWGDPLLRLTIDWQDNERRLSRYMGEKMALLGKATGAKKVRVNAPLAKYDVNTYRSTHVQGGAIMGDSPATSVVNPWLQHWDASNVFVLGASAFPQNASGNPTLTVLALTMRAADAVVERYLPHPGPLA